MKTQLVPDDLLSQRLSTGCWYTCGVGISAIQLGLYTALWQVTHQAFPPALAAAAWLAGGQLRHPEQRGLPPRLSSATFVLLALLAGVNMLSLPGDPAGQEGDLVLSVVLAGALGWSSATWLQDPAPGWPPPAERARITLGLCSTVSGLLLVWLCRQFAPAWGALPNSCGLLLVLPACALSWCRTMRCPLPPLESGEQRRQAALLHRGNAFATTLARELDRAALPVGWWLLYLWQRGRLALVVVSSLFSALELALWSGLSTPFAAQLPARTRLLTLCWLLAGQIVACGLAYGLLCGPMRSVFGLPGRLFPAWFTLWARKIVFLLATMAAGCLAALSLPALQDAHLLAACLAGYTLTAFLIAVLLPRTLPSLYEQGQAALPALASTALPRLLAVRRAEELLAEQARVRATTWLTCLLVPAVGLVIDRTSVEEALTAISAVLAIWAIAGLLLTWRTTQEQPLRYWLAHGGSRQAWPAVRGENNRGRMVLPPADATAAHQGSKIIPTRSLQEQKGISIVPIIEEEKPYVRHHTYPIITSGSSIPSLAPCSSSRR